MSYGIRLLVWLFALEICLVKMAFSEPALVQVEQAFSSDPGWDNYQNRIVGTNMPVRAEDFGWSLTAHSTQDGIQGEIGGKVVNSRVQAYYAMPLGRPLTFNDKISVSGRFSLKELGSRGVSYFGFFNSRRHTWRVYSSMAFRLWEEENKAQIMFDWMSSDWRGRGQETAAMILPDGRAHTFTLTYDPDAKTDSAWRDALLEKHITSETGNGRPIEIQGESFILERAKKDEPNLTAESLHKRLLEARDQGLVQYFQRHGQHRWWKTPHPEQNHGKVVLQIDQETPYVIWFDEDIRKAPVELDRFGLFNICRYGTDQTVYFSDLTLNGQKIDLSQDPHWIGQNNHATWVETDFHAMNNFGWSQTNWAGKSSGECGGLLWRIEPEEPEFGYYADEVGTLTLDDPISFSGNICFVDGMTDSSMFFGYFSKEDYVRTGNISDTKQCLFPMMGIGLNDSTDIGYAFAPLVSSAEKILFQDRNRYLFTPDRKPCAFSFNYDPKGNNGSGHVSYSLDGKEGGFDLTPEQRKSGIRFDHFGLACPRSGGGSVEIYFDDLKYTARRDPAQLPVFHKQILKEVAYPEKSAGRRR